MEVGLLGPLVVRVDGRVVTVSSARERAVLSVLALRAPAAVSLDELIDVLWGEQPPGSARKSVQMFVSGLRRLLPAGRRRAIPTKRPGLSPKR